MTAATHPLWRPYAPPSGLPRPGRIDRRQIEPYPLRTVGAEAGDDYRFVSDLIRSALPDEPIVLQHIGSTAVPGLLAKPVIDLDLVVAEPVDDVTYLPALQAAGLRLVFRDELAGSAHRQLTLDVPNANLHVWGPDAVEPDRHRLFVAWLRSHPDDRARYAAVKVAASGGRDGYNERKAGVVYDIYERAFAADTAHRHEPQPRLSA